MSFLEDTSNGLRTMASSSSDDEEDLAAGAGAEVCAASGQVLAAKANTVRDFLTWMFIVGFEVRLRQTAPIF